MYVWLFSEHRQDWVPAWVEGDEYFIAGDSRAYTLVKKNGEVGGYARYQITFKGSGESVPKYPSVSVLLGPRIQPPELPDHHHNAVYECEQCSSHSSHENLTPLRDAEQRVSAGEPFPAGECQKCGGAMHRLPNWAPSAWSGIA